MKDVSKNPYYRPKIQRILNKLISEEWMAGQMYMFYLNSMEDGDRENCCGTFTEISVDETDDHMESLIAFAHEYGYNVPCKVKEFEKYADPMQVKLYGSFSKTRDVEYYLEYAMKSEIGAIQSYQECLEEYDEIMEFGDLVGILQKNLVEEQEHLEKLRILDYSNKISVRIGGE